MWVWRCLLGGNASLPLPGFSGCCRKGVPAILEVFPSSHFCLCSPYAFFKVNLTLYPKKTTDQTADLALFVGVSVCNLLPSAARPSPASPPGSPAFLLASSLLPSGVTSRRHLSVGQKERVLWRFSGLPVTFGVCMSVRLMRVSSKRWTGYRAWPSGHNIQVRSSIQRFKSFKNESAVTEKTCFFSPGWNLWGDILKNNERNRELCISGEEICYALAIKLRQSRGVWWECSECVIRLRWWLQWCCCSEWAKPCMS